VVVQLDELDFGWFGWRNVPVGEIAPVLLTVGARG